MHGIIVEKQTNSPPLREHEAAASPTVIVHEHDVQQPVESFKMNEKIEIDASILETGISESLINEENSSEDDDGVGILGNQVLFALQSVKSPPHLMEMYKKRKKRFEKEESTTPVTCDVNEKFDKDDMEERESTLKDFIESIVQCVLDDVVDYFNGNSKEENDISNLEKRKRYSYTWSKYKDESEEGEHITPIVSSNSPFVFCASAPEFKPQFSEIYHFDDTAVETSEVNNSDAELESALSHYDDSESWGPYKGPAIDVAKEYSEHATWSCLTEQFEEVLDIASEMSCGAPETELTIKTVQPVEKLSPVEAGYERCEISEGTTETLLTMTNVSVSSMEKMPCDITEKSVVNDYIMNNYHTTESLTTTEAVSGAADNGHEEQYEVTTVAEHDLYPENNSVETCYDIKNNQEDSLNTDNNNGCHPLTESVQGVNLSIESDTDSQEVTADHVAELVNKVKQLLSKSSLLRPDAPEFSVKYNSFTSMDENVSTSSSDLGVNVPTFHIRDDSKDSHIGDDSKDSSYDLDCSEDPYPPATVEMLPPRSTLRAEAPVFSSSTSQTSQTSLTNSPLSQSPQKVVTHNSDLSTPYGHETSYFSINNSGDKATVSDIWPKIAPKKVRIQREVGTMTTETLSSNCCMCVGSPASVQKVTYRLVQCQVWTI